MRRRSSALFILFLFYSFTSIARSKDLLQNDINTFISKLNTAFDLRVKLKLVSKCGFRVDTEANLQILACEEDIEFFSHLEDGMKATNGLLTIIGHEYSHILLEWDITAASTRDYESSIFGAAKSIAAKNNLDSNDVFSFLLEIDHENKDSLGVKLVMWAGYEPDPSVMHELKKIVPHSESITIAYIKSRVEVLETSKNEGLQKWSDYRCISPNINFRDSLFKFKTWALKNSLTPLLEPIENSCSFLDVSILFDKRMKSYNKSKSF